MPHSPVVRLAPASAVALLSAIALVLLAVAVKLGATTELDVALVGAAAQLRDGAVGSVIGGLSALGQPIPWAILVLALALPLALGHRRAAALLAATLTAELLVITVKLVVMRSRPESADLLDLFGNESFAFPSGHVARAVTLVAVVAWLMAGERSSRLSRAVLAGSIAGVAMGIARVADGVHWPSDVLGGLLTGLIWFGLAAAIAIGPRAVRDTGRHA